MQYASNTILFRISFSAAEVKIFAKMHSFPASRILGLQKTKQNVATKINIYNSCGELFSAIHIHIYKLIVHTYNSMPERIYNSHYGNGVPAMFTPQCYSAKNPIAVIGLQVRWAVCHIFGSPFHNFGKIYENKYKSKD